VVGALWVAVGRGLPFARPSCSLSVDRSLKVGDVVRRIDVAAGEAWAIGSSYVAAVGRPLALHRATGGWIAEPVPVDSDTTTVGLHDVVALPSGEAWAVGSVKAREPFAVRWDGEGFVRIATADLGVDAEWLGVGGSPEGGVWAVGKRTDGLRYRTLVARADGDRFVVVPSPNQGDGNDVLSDVDVAGEVAWAVGWTYGADARFHPLTMRLADGAWELVAAPAPAGDAFLTTVVAVADGTAWAVGWRTMGEDGARALVLRFDGTTWTEVAPPTEAWTRLLGADTSAGRLVVVGESHDGDRRSAPAAWTTDDEGATWRQVALGGGGTRWFTGVDLAGETTISAVGASLDGTQRSVGFLASGC
jgi:hypothetical protein